MIVGAQCEKNQTLLKQITKINTIKKNENNIINFKSYLYRTVQTTLWDAARSLEKQTQVGSDWECDDLGERPDEELVHNRMQLDRLLEQLSPEESRMIRAHLKGFNNEEIAVLIGCGEGRVRNLLTRIKKKLAKWGKQ